MRLVLAVILALWAVSARAQPVKSLLEMRYEHVVKQQWDLDCGSAALATLMTYDLGVLTSDKEAALWMIRSSGAERIKKQQGFSLLNLKRFAQVKGFEAAGYGSMTLVELKTLGASIVPLELGEHAHFVVFRGTYTDRGQERVLLADPAWGMRSMSTEEFLSVWRLRVAFEVFRQAAV